MNNIVIEHKEQIPNTPEWLEERKLNTFNSSTFYEKCIGHRYKGRAYKKDQILVLTRRGGKGEDVVVPETPINDVQAFIFQEGHDGEAKVKNAINGIRPADYRVIHFADNLSIGVTPDGVYDDVPVEIKTMSSYATKILYWPSSKWLHQMILQSISRYTDKSIFMRLERDGKVRGCVIRWKIDEYIEDLLAFWEALEEDSTIFAPKRLCLCEYFYTTQEDLRYFHCSPDQWWEWYYINYN